MIAIKVDSFKGETGSRGEARALSDPVNETEAAFEAIFLKNYERIVAVLFRLVGNLAQADELANDVFWKLYRRPLYGDQEHNIFGWLYRTATRLGIDALRSAYRRQRYETAAHLNNSASDLSSDPLNQVLRDEKRFRVRKILARLKRAQAQVLILRHSGLSYKELAEVIGVRSSSIGTLLARAEAEFEKQYVKIYGGKD